MIAGICTCLGVSDDPMYLWIFSNSCPLKMLLVRSHQAEIIIVKRLIQGRNNVTRVRVEPRPFDQGRRKNEIRLRCRQSCHLSTYWAAICLPLMEKVSNCPFNWWTSNREAVNRLPIFIVFGLTRLGIKPKSPISVANAAFTRPLISYIGRS